MPLSSTQWRLELSKSWDILGPFPIHAREQHFLEPWFPIDVTSPINYSTSYPSSYADGGRVSWSKAQADNDGVLKVLFPHSVRWKSLRDTEGWAALQHHALLKTSLTVYPASSPPPNIRIQLIGGSYLTIVPLKNSNIIPRSYAGNIYDIEHALPRVIELPEPPSLFEPTTYDIFVAGDYEIRLFGDPRVQNNSDVPTQTIKLEVEFDKTEQVVWEPTLDIVPDIVSGWTFGDAVGIGLRTRDSWWSVHEVKLAKPLEEFLSLKFPAAKFRLAPTQARILPLRIEQHRSLPPEFTTIEVALTLVKESPNLSLQRDSDDTLMLQMSLPITHVAMWHDSDSSLPSSNPVIKGSYFFGISDSIPTNFLVVPPKLPGKGLAPILALHGSGIDMFSPSPLESFWAQALPRQDHSWVVIPNGRTSWGLDWHGPSAQDAWRVLDAVADLLQNSQATWGGGKWGVPFSILTGKPQAIVMGHSNGGQGAWYIAERFPDRVLGVVPASGYIKSQSYVPWTMSRSARFADPFLEAILQTSLTPDDNDLFLGNLHGKSVLVVHGANDENVPVWHSREMAGLLESLHNDKSQVKYEEIPNQPHWFPSVLNNDLVQSFIDRLVQADPMDEAQVQPESFKLTVALPSETGSMRGWHVEKLSVPGRLGRVSVSITGTGTSRIDVGTINIHEFSVDLSKFDVLNSDSELWIDGQRIHLDVKALEGRDIIYFKATDSGVWRLNSAPNTLQLSGRIQTMLSNPDPANDPVRGPAPLVFVVPNPALDSDSSSTITHTMSVALRLAHDLHLYHRLDSEIILSSEAGFALSEPNFASALSRGNVVVVGNEAAAQLKQGELPFTEKETFFTVEEFLAKVHIHKDKTFSPDSNQPDPKPGQGILFLHPHPMNSYAKMLLLQSTDTLGAGLERAARLFPIRTGVPVPDWIIVGDDDRTGEGNVVATGLWDSEWDWNVLMTWSSTT